MKRIRKVAVARDGHCFYVKDESQDLHTQFGVLSHKDFKKSKASTNTGKELRIYKPSFADFYHKMKRGPQMVPLKDIGIIIAETGIGKNSIVVDSGSGSGGTSLAFANVAKVVHSFELREDFYNIAVGNKEFVGVKNVNYEIHDITTGIPVSNADLVFLDMPTPWLVVRHAEKTLKKGGFLVAYCPTVPQVMDFVSEVKNSETFISPWTKEVSEREWELEGRKVRPKSQRIGHSGFLTFTRFVG